MFLFNISEPAQGLIILTNGREVRERLAPTSNRQSFDQFPSIRKLDQAILYSSLGMLGRKIMRSPGNYGKWACTKHAYWQRL